MTPEELVDHCLDFMGPLTVEPDTHNELVEQAEVDGQVSWTTDEDYAVSSRRVGDVMALIAGTREYQMG